MALDATVRESNVWDSIRKFFVDNLAKGGPAIPIMFDSGISEPKVSGNKDLVEKWLNIESGEILTGSVSSYKFDVVCCTRKDNAGFKLTQLRDTLMQYLKPNGEQGIIPLYQTRVKPAPWTDTGIGMLICIDSESKKINATNEIKFKVLTITLLWGAIA